MQNASRLARNNKVNLTQTEAKAIFHAYTNSWKQKLKKNGYATFSPFGSLRVRLLRSKRAPGGTFKRVKFAPMKTSSSQNLLREEIQAFPSTPMGALKPKRNKDTTPPVQSKE